ncbi:MAG: extracellular solute-binding protein [Nitrososphaerota archaeon]|nr:extracellular solute-binding protein [Nitrososphaerota archaeon]
MDKFMRRKYSRRQAIGTAGKVALGVVVAGVVGAVGGYLAGSAQVPAERTVTVRETVTTTVTKTVTATTPATIVTTPTVVTKRARLVQMMLHADPNEQLHKMAEKYCSEVRPDIEIDQIIGQPTGGAVAEFYRLQVEAARARSPTMDILNLDVIWGAAFNANEWCIDLSNRFPPSEREKFVPAMIESWSWDGRIGAVPWMADIGGLWYRKDIVEEKEGIKPPPDGWEWEEFFQICVELKEKYPNMDMLAIDNGKSEQLICNFQEFLASNGGEWFDEEWNVLIADTPAVEALQAMHDMIHKYKICHPETLTGDLEIARKRFVEEARAIFHRNWCYVWGTSLGSPVEGKIWETLIPHFPGHESKSCVGGWSWGINPGSRYIEEAWEYIQWLTSYDVMKQMMLGGGFLQARIDLYNDPDVIKVIPIAPAYYKLYERGTVRPKHPEYMSISDMAQTEIHAALSGVKGVEQALSDLAQQIASFLGTRVVKR